MGWFTKDKTSDLAGWVGIAAIQGSTLPSIASAIFNGEAARLPPLNMVLFVWIGLVLFLYRGIIRRDTVAIVSNTIGFALNTILLAILTFP